MSEKTVWETIKTEGTELLGAVKKLVHEGNVRRVRIKQDERVIAEFPLTVGVVGTVFAPILAAIGAVVALVQDCSIEVERTETEPVASPAPERECKAEPAAAASGEPASEAETAAEGSNQADPKA